MANNAGRAFIPLNGDEIKRLVMQRVQAILDADTRLKTHIAYPQVAFSVGFRMTYYPSDSGPIELAVEGVLGQAPEGAPRLVPPDAVTEELAPMTSGHVVNGAQPVGVQRVSRVVGKQTAPGVKSYGTGPAPDRMAVRANPTARESVTARVQQAIRETEQPAPANRPVVGRRLTATRPAETVGDPIAQVDGQDPNLPDRYDTSIDPSHLAIEGDNARTLRQPARSSQGQGEPIVGGAQPIPAGIAAIIEEAQRPERVAAEGMRLRQKLEAQGQHDDVLTASEAISSPNTARRDGGLPIPSARPSRNDRGNMVDTSEF